jgi:DNA polymerase III psi subunit
LLHQYLFHNETLFHIVEPTIDAVATPSIVEKTKVDEVVVSPIPAPAPPTPVEEIRPVFVHKHRVMVLVQNLPDADADLLVKILKAVNLNMNDIDLLQMEKLKGIDLTSILQDKYVHHVLTFGVPLKQLNLSILLVPYQAKQVEGINFLFSDPFAILHQDTAKKKALWTSLKQLFGV